MPSQESFNQRLKTIAEGVLSLEINTIVCAHIEAEKMPQPEHALIDLANEYGAWLRERHKKDVFTPGEPSKASAAFFQTLRQAATELLRNGEDANLLERIRKNSDQLMGIFLRIDAGRAQPIELTRAQQQLPQEVELKPEELLVVRKAWELMLDEIAMQTTIQIDGDVVQRILRRAPKGVDLDQVMKAHERAVDISTSFWGDLVGLIGGALKGLGQLLTGGKSS
jgi:hypothetical protein